jgi:hypothetical protein
MELKATTKHIEALNLAGSSPVTVAVLDDLSATDDASFIRVRAVGRVVGTPGDVTVFSDFVSAVNVGPNAGISSSYPSFVTSGPGTVGSMTVVVNGYDVELQTTYFGGTSIDWTIDVEVTRHV